MRGRPVMTWAAAAVTVLSLASCSMLEADEPDEPGSDESPASSAEGGHPSGQPTIPPELQECDGSTGGSKGDQGEQVDLTDALVASDASWDVPGGFEESDGYYDDQDYEQPLFMHTYVPTSGPYDFLDLLGVLGYGGLDWGELAAECGRVPLEAMLERVAEYREMLGAEALGEAEQTEMAGLPAVTQELRIEDYDFRGYWLFSQTELFYISCQWTSDAGREGIEEACTDLVSTVQVG